MYKPYNDEHEKEKYHENKPEKANVVNLRKSGESDTSGKEQFKPVVNLRKSDTSDTSDRQEQLQSVVNLRKSDTSNTSGQEQFKPVVNLRKSDTSNTSGKEQFKPVANLRTSNASNTSGKEQFKPVANIKTSNASNTSGQEQFKPVANLRTSNASNTSGQEQFKPVANLRTSNAGDTSGQEQFKPVANLRKSDTSNTSGKEQFKPVANIKTSNASNTSERYGYSNDKRLRKVADSYDFDNRRNIYGEPAVNRGRFPNVADRREEPVANNYGNYEQTKEKSGIVIMLVMIIILLLVAIGVMGGIFIGGKYFRKSENNTGTLDNFQVNNNAQPVPAEVITTVADEFPTADENGVIAFQTGTIINETPEVPEPAPQSEFVLPKINIDPVSVSNDSVKEAYLNIVKNANIVVPDKGFLVDLNGDGINEMILTNSSEMNYIIYYFSGSTIQSCKFGGYHHIDDIRLFKVDGNNGEKYLYYKCEVKYKSSQGYFHLNSHTTLHISINYPENNGAYSADWNIRFSNGETYATGNEPVETFYAQPADCHNKLLSAFSHYKYSIDQNSSYTKLDSLTKDELINALGGAKKVEKPVQKEEKPAQPPAQTYSCNKKGQLNTHGGIVSGYATSYVVNNGASAKIRDSLGNAWHVTAVQYCESRGVFWYELYDTDDGDYYGWVDVNFIDFYSSNSNSNNNTVSQSVQVTPCYLTGQINGTGVAGFTTSYVVNGGAISTVRDTLGDAWHVTAVNTCVSKGIVWYELYDTDDNDYYGWVDGNYIRFY